jgi:hypothetical protein
VPPPCMPPPITPSTVNTRSSAPAASP